MDPRLWSNRPESWAKLIEEANKEVAATLVLKASHSLVPLGSREHT